MNSNGSIRLAQEDTPQKVNSNGIQSVSDVISNADGGKGASAQVDIPSDVPNGSISGNPPISTTDEKTISRDVTSGRDNTLPGQQELTSTPAPNHQTPSTSNGTVDGSTNPVLTPFLHPHASASLPAPPPLTPEQEAKYDTLLTTARSWTTIASSSSRSPVTTPLTPSEKLWLTRDCLLRYLRASKWVVPTAATRLQATLTWRREYGLELHTAAYISEENETGKQVILGYDTSGRPCLYLNPHKQNTKESKRQMHHLVFMLERCIDLMAPGVETLALLVNFKDSRRGQSASVSQGRETISILQNHYPERLGRALVQDVPWLIWGFFKAIGPFIDPLTREKLKFDEDLRILVPPEQLLVQYKGDVEFEYVHEKYWTALNGLAEERRRETRDRWERAGAVVGESESYLKGIGESVGGAGVGAETSAEKDIAAGGKVDA